MTLQEHCIQGTVLSSLIYPFYGPEAAVLFFVSFVLIDVDHYLLYIWKTGRFDPAGMFRFCSGMDVYHNRVISYCCFHSIEAVLLLGFASVYISSFFLVVLAAFSMHMLFDMWQLWQEKRFSARVYSIPEYLIRKKSGNYITNLPQEKTLWEKFLQTESYER